MLNKRQNEILLILLDNANQIVTGQYLSKALDISLRTMQKEMKDIIAYAKLNDLKIESIRSKGYKLVNTNETSLKKMKFDLLSTNYAHYNDQAFRITYIINKLTDNNEYIKIDDLANELFFSSSTITNDLKEVKKILKRYSLNYQSKPNYGIALIGEERNIRSLISNELVIYNKNNLNLINGSDDIIFNDINDIVSDVLVKYHFKVSDIIYQNLLMHIFIMIKRIQKNKYVSLHNRSILGYDKARETARSILSNLSNKYNINIPEDEVLYLQSILTAKNNYDHDDMINSETNNLVDGMLSYVKEKTGFDFSYNINLKVSLALHILPLKIRLENNVFIPNELAEDVKAHYTLSFEIATIASDYLNSVTGYTLDLSEIGYLAVYFNYGIEALNPRVKTKNVLILCNSRRGDSLLLKQSLFKRFKDNISKIDVLNIYETSKELINEYDIVFSTIQGNQNVPENAIQINYFLNENDYERIERALTEKRELAKLIDFSKEEFFVTHMKASSKEEVIKKLTILISEKICFDKEKLYDLVMKREEYGYTSFVNHIAMPHPFERIECQTVIAVAVLEEPIKWNDYDVQLVILANINANKDDEYSLFFESISRLITHKKAIDKVISKQSYENFISTLNELFITL